MRLVTRMTSTALLEGVIVITLLRACSPFSLTILHTNDVHARFEQMNKYGGSCSEKDGEAGKCFGGLARIRTKVEELRSEDPNTLFLDAGDQYQGTVWFNIYGGNSTVHFMNLLEYDAMSLGNHEFDDRPAGLRVLVENANFPILSANINASAAPFIEAKVTASIVKDVGGEKVGIIGYTTKDTSEISKPAPVTFSDEAAAIRREVDRLTSQGVNKIIALGHAGYQRDQQLALDVSGVDVIVGGHSHTFLYTGEPPNREKPEGPYPTVLTRSDGSKVLVVQDFCFGKYLGFLKVEFDDGGKVTSWSGNPILLNNSVEQNAGILEQVSAWCGGVNAVTKKVIGETAVFLDGDSQTCRLKECNLGNMFTDAMIRYALRPSKGDNWNHVAVAIINSGGVRSSLPKGDISVANILEVSPFRDTFDIVELNGSAIWKVMEKSASKWNPGQTQGGFLQASGLRVVIDISRPVGSRVVEIKIRCANCSVPRFVELEPSKVYKIILATYIADGNDGYQASIRDSTLKRYPTGDLATDALTDYVTDFSPITHGLEGRIRLLNCSDPASNDPECKPKVCKSEASSRAQSMVAANLWAVMTVFGSLAVLRGG